MKTIHSEKEKMIECARDFDFISRTMSLVVKAESLRSIDKGLPTNKSFLASSLEEERLFEKVYVNALDSTLNKVRKLFSDAGIEYRLYDIDYAFVDPLRLAMVWFPDGKEISFMVTFYLGDIHGRIEDPTYRVVRIGDGGDGQVVRGHADPNDFSFIEQPLPEWFVDLLRSN